MKTAREIAEGWNGILMDAHINELELEILAYANFYMQQEREACAQQEREACAQLADSLQTRQARVSGVDPRPEDINIAAAIRQRGK